MRRHSRHWSVAGNTSNEGLGAAEPLEAHPESGTRTRRPLALVGIGLVILAFVVVVIVATPLVGFPAVSRTAAQDSAFCVTARKIVGRLPSALTEVAPRQARSFAKQLKTVSRATPDAMAETVHTLVTDLHAVAGAPTKSTREAIVTHQSAGFAAASLAFATYQSEFCPGKAPGSTGFGPVVGASSAACTSDAGAIRMAEELYSGVNGSFASMSELVDAGFLRSVSRYYSEVSLGSPPSGYTIVAAPDAPCGDVPVAG